MAPTAVLLAPCSQDHPFTSDIHVPSFPCRSALDTTVPFGRTGGVSTLRCIRKTAESCNRPSTMRSSVPPALGAAPREEGPPSAPTVATGSLGGASGSPRRNRSHLPLTRGHSLQGRWRFPFRGRFRPRGVACSARGGRDVDGGSPEVWRMKRWAGTASGPRVACAAVRAVGQNLMTVTSAGYSAGDAAGRASSDRYGGARVRTSGTVHPITDLCAERGHGVVGSPAP
ncbi:hypothetical protein FHX37_1036 [Haloactinospora alba]|uniref:Uncharacterized protein n=1 Tax=Haloactinospora alba TaxID=405555 RepID=A0A543NH17_9ACTN|nr:hypothetical protein FHX37_1036 [Haloactinospora alba]